jgi:hypothetical protein
MQTHKYGILVHKSVDKGLKNDKEIPGTRQWTKAIEEKMEAFELSSLSMMM